MSKSRMFTLKDDTRLLLLYRFFYSIGLVSQISAGNHHNHYPFPGAAEGSRKCDLKNPARESAECGPNFHQ